MSTYIPCWWPKLHSWNKNVFNLCVTFEQHTFRNPKKMFHLLHMAHAKDSLDKKLLHFDLLSTEMCSPIKCKSTCSAWSYQPKMTQYTCKCINRFQSNTFISLMWVNSSLPGQNGRHLADDIFKCISLIEKHEFRLTIHWSLFLRVQLTIRQHLIQIMAWRRPRDKPSSEPMLTRFIDAYMRH